MIKQQTELGNLQVASNEIFICYEKEEIKIPLDFREKKDQMLFNILNNLQERVSSLEVDLRKEKLFNTTYMERGIPDHEAKEEIINYIQNLKRMGISKVNIIDMVSNLHLSAEQIERIMDQLEGKTV